MSQNPIITKGLPTGSGGNGPVPIRREIRDLEQNYPDLWNLYLQGLDALQKVDEDDPLSYYQIAGIHGRPYKAWPDDAGKQHPLGSGGYCTHNSILFPTWHRPYLSLFEETLYRVIQNIASSFPDPNDRARYVAAAQDFRIPYWDWAMPVQGGDSVLPGSMQADTVQVVTPTSGGQPTDLKNPLYSFDFHPLNPSQGDFPLKETGRGPQRNNVFATWPSSIRYPDNATANAVSQNDQAEAALEQQVRNLRELVFYLVTSYKRYGAFSNNQWNRGQPGRYGSIEGVHDTVHDVSGGGGHMSVVAYAAFDPLFWLHHCNVDRLFALWQAIHPSGPDSFVTSQPDAAGTFTTSAGGTETQKSPLTPFYSNPGTFWTSDGIRNTLTLGYAYPETQSWNFQTPAAYESSVTAAVTQLYGGNSLATMMRNRSQPGAKTTVQVKTAGTARALPQMKMAVKAPAETAKTATDNNTNSHANVDTNPFISVPTIRNGNIGLQAPLAEQSNNGGTPVSRDVASTQSATNGDAQPAEQITRTEAPPATSALPASSHNLPSNNKYNEYLTNIRTLKHSLSTTFRVHIFLGALPSTALAFSTSPNLVGTFVALGDSADTGCSKCQRDRENDLMVTGQVPLTIALAERVQSGEFAGLGEGDVVPYLRENLHWRVSLCDGTEVPLGEVPDLKVMVISNEVTLPEAADQLPVYAEHVRVHPEVTSGRGEGTGLNHEGEA